MSRKKGQIKKHWVTSLGHRELKGGPSCIIWDFLLQMADSCSHWLTYKWEFVDSSKGKSTDVLTSDIIWFSCHQNPVSLSLITGLGLLQADPISNQALFWSFWSCKILSLVSRSSRKAFASVSALSGKLVLHLIGDGQSPCLCLPEPLLQLGEKAAEESKKTIGSDTPEPSAPRGERGSHRTHIGYHFSIRMKDAVLQIPDVLPGPLLSLS